MIDFVLPKKQPPSRARVKRNLYQLLIARSDIHAAIEACKLFSERVTALGDDLYYPLFAAIVVCYARPFTQNEPFGPLPQKWGRFADPGYQDVHDKLIAARQEMIAHSDMSVRKAKIVPAGARIGIWKEREISSSRVSAQTGFYLYPVGFFPRAWATATDLHQRIHAEAERLIVELYGGMELPARSFWLRLDDGL
jgi:hypothetical protein